MTELQGETVTNMRSHKVSLSTLGLACASLLATGIALLPPIAHADTAPTPLDAYGSTAMSQAMQTGQPVIVDNTTTETSQVTAEPDGQFQLTTSQSPVRAQTATGWQPIDTTLQANSDGTFSPKVTTAHVAFSGGGNSLLVGIGTSQTGINTYWPTNLPTPTVSGNTITYPNVRPNVNLVMSAQPSGFSETLVVNTPSAAQNIANNPITLTAYGNGVTVSQRSDGTITGTDASGHAVFGGAPPSAWDSSVNNAEPAVKSNAFQSANATQRALGMSAHAVTGGQALTLTVPSTLLSSPTLQYPIYVDPEIGPGQTNWETLESDGTSYGYSGSSTQPMRVGYCYWTGCVPMGYKADSFFSFDTTALVGKATTAHIFTADVSALQVYNAASYSTPVNLTRAGAITSTMSYPGPVDATLQQVSQSCGYNGGAGCNLHFNNSNVISYMQDDANSGWTHTTFALTSPDTTNANYWKKFGSATGTADNEVLTVKYDFPPTGPYVLSIDSHVDCRPQGQPLYIYSPTPTVSAKAYSQDGMNVGMYFHVEPTTGPKSTTLLSGGTVQGNSTPAPSAIGGASGSQIGWTTPTLQDGNYAFQAQAQDMSTTSGTTGEKTAWDAYTAFTVRSTGPDQAPTVASYSYPSSAWGVTSTDAARAFTFTDTSTDTAGIAGFTYSIDNKGGEAAISGCAPYDVTYNNGSNTGIITATNGVATWQPPSGTLTSGCHTLYVKAFNNAHLTSAESTPYPFCVAPTYSTTSNLVEAEGSGISSITPASPTQPGGYYTSSNSADSAGADTELATSAPGSFTFTLNPISSSAPISYDALGVQLLTGTHNATVTFQVDGKNVYDTNGNLITADTCAAPVNGVQPTMFVPLGGFQLDGSKTHTITIQMTSVDGSAMTPNCSLGYTYSGNYGPQQTALNFNDNGYTVGVDDFIVAPIRDATYNNFQSAVNNIGIAYDGKQGASFEPGVGGDNSLSWTALTNAGIIPGNLYKYNSGQLSEVDFPIPSIATNGDNVIAAGQTIDLTDNNNPLPAPAGSSSTNPGYLDLLVAATCGDVPASHSQGLSIDYITSKGDVQLAGTDNLLPWIPNWLNSSGPTSAPIGIAGNVVKLDHYDDSSGSPVTQAGINVPAYLYVWKVPIPQGYAGDYIRYVVLPNLGSDLSNTCDATGNALHVLSITDSLH